MDAKEFERQFREIYMDVKEVSASTGHTETTVRNWLRYHRYIPFVEAFEKPWVLRSEFRDFQKKHPELCKGLLNMKGEENE